jgi:hypothetical protein
VEALSTSTIRQRIQEAGDPVGYAAGADGKQAQFFDRSRSGISPGSSSQNRYFNLGSVMTSSWDETADLIASMGLRRPTRRGAVEPSLEVLREAADAVDPFATEVVAETIRRKRDPRITRYVQKRAGGVSEFSGEAFPWGLKCHHVDAIGEHGPDTRFNVIALTPNEHARADADPEFNALVRARLEEVEPS